MINLSKRNMILGSVALAALALASGQTLAQDLTGLNDPPAYGEMVLGPDTAKVTVIEYASATCPHCAAFYNDTFITLKKEYIDTGKIRFILREFPHNDAAQAAFMLARCAPKEKYFPLIDIFFLTQPEWTQSPFEGLSKIAQQAGFTQAEFEACMKNETIAKQVMDVRKKAEGFGVTGIPTFFINGELYKGDTSIEAMRALIDPLLV